MVKIKLKGFLLAESMIALIIAILGVTSIALIVGQSRATERKLELKTDRVYAWHVLKKASLTKIEVHDCVYELAGNQSVYDATNKKIYQIKK
ncbi:hypothetical protein OZX56_05620 [Lactobacillus sp. ESL0684]|uniref:hypothetical protein n=1 Tax=Lactobacillus sp. ESL0684 TaxID=2983213 RepID=UPI0023F8BFE7|nr:hypothetical protein [Lactobacillus sp. ESL0684]WEV43025.1 hypothetical protein OZX56_05620 [Lactobacillus sp. ESL0684]